MKTYDWLSNEILTGSYAHITWEQRFWMQVQVGNVADCWEWQGKLYSNGYGFFGGPKASSHLAHRIAYWIANASVDGVICHKCDNRKCVNPSHLFSGTMSDNVQDALSKGRIGRVCSYAKAQAIREMYETGLYTQQYLAGVFSVSKHTVTAIVNNRIWKESRVTEVIQL